MTTDVYDGLDIQAEFDRLLKLPEFTYPLLIKSPRLEIQRFGHVPNTHGVYSPRRHRVKINLPKSEDALYVDVEGNERRYDRFDAQEVLIHELAHSYARQRYGPEIKAHGKEFWRHLDAAFQEAYGPIDVAPRTNRYHGRYAKALRHQALERREVELINSIDDLVAVEPRSPITADQLPEPLRTYQMADEPNHPVSFWLNGRDEDGWGVRVGEPITGNSDTPIQVRRVRDDQVFTIINRVHGQSRASIEDMYRRRHGNYPGKSVYNSMWRLRRDGKIRREGHRWYPT